LVQHPFAFENFPSSHPIGKVASAKVNFSWSTRQRTRKKDYAVEIVQYDLEADAAERHLLMRVFFELF
jgi:hypothetical protein